MEGNFRSSPTQAIWDSSAFGLDMDCFFNPTTIEHSVMDQSDPFESALSSIVSSPVASSNVSTICNNVESDMMMHELVGRLGNISNYADFYNKNSTSANTSSYNTPLNSPPKQQIRACASLPGIQFPTQLPTLESFSTDPGFIERAARLSCLGSRSFSSLNGQFENGSELRHPGKISRALEGPPLNVAYGSQSKGKEVSKSLPRTGNQENAETGASREGSSISDQIPVGEWSTGGQNDANSRKRKSVPKGKPKDATADDKVAKKSKTDENDGNVKDNGAVENAGPSEKDKISEENANKKQNKDNSKPSEPPKDYIHVRARRGQATDSHSLAERVRREKISERMKFLQDLVPGCNKVTGKAAMLDEIINYVQSLQRQVEFLSMKLANVNSRIDPDAGAMLSKDLLQSNGSILHSMLPNNSLIPSLSYGYQSQQGLFIHNGIPNNNGQSQMTSNPLNAANAIQRNQSIQLPPMNPFGQAPPQISSIWEEDLQNIVPIGSAAATQMKIES